MSPTTPRMLSVLALLVLAPPALAAWPHDAYTNVNLTPTGNDQLVSGICPDSAGGAFVAWIEKRGDPSGDVWMTRVGVDGAPSPGWPAGGVSVCSASGAQNSISVIPGPGGSCYVCWLDARAGGGARDVYLQRMLASGAIGPGWPVNGLLLSRTGFDESVPVMATDGAGGAYVAWQLTVNAVSGDYDIHARRVNADGSFPAGFTSASVALTSLINLSTNPAIAADGSGNAYVVWEDDRVTPVGIFGQRLLANGTPFWAVNGIQLQHDTGPFALDIVRPRIAGDGQGGFLLGTFWVGSSGFLIMTGRYNPAGAAVWPVVNVGPTYAIGLQIDFSQLRVAADGNGGAFLGYTALLAGDLQSFVQHLSPAGAQLWGATPVPVLGGSGWQTAIDFSGPYLTSSMEPDGLGGVVFALSTLPNSGTSIPDLVVQRIAADGSLAWGSGGRLVCGVAATKLYPVIASDLRGGFIVAWNDYRKGTTSDIYAQRLDHWSYLGNAEPSAVSAVDVPYDQGGVVNVRWHASYLDALPDRTVRQYSLWRALSSNAPPVGATILGPGDPTPADATIDADGADAAVAAGAAGVARSETLPSGSSRIVRALPDGAQTTYWEYLFTKAATALTDYAAVAPTTSDSLPGANPPTQFMVQAEGFFGDPYWAAAPASGYSVDNLAPPTPAPFTGVYGGGQTALDWGASLAADLAGYRLYRGSSIGFVPGPANLVAALATTAYTDRAGQPYVYKLAAVDVHGNESAYATLIPAGTADVTEGALPVEFALHGATPNPLRGSGLIRYALPRAAAVRLALFDAAGRRVRLLADGERPAGEHAAAWDGRDDAGRALGAGLYFARLDAAGRTFTHRVVLTH